MAKLLTESLSSHSMKRKFRTIIYSNYDISNTCNLTCEGCFYFVSGQKASGKRPTPEHYDTFFASEQARGVNYPQFSGGEPSKNHVALRIAAKYWKHGIVYTNGIRKTDPDIPFRIAVSVWGTRERTNRLRGENAYDQALETAKGDHRALIYLTINSQNIEDIPDVVADCRAHRLKIAFNDFSMTRDARDKLQVLRQEMMRLYYWDWDLPAQEPSAEPETALETVA